MTLTSRPAAWIRRSGVASAAASAHGAIASVSRKTNWRASAASSSRSAKRSELSTVRVANSAPSNQSTTRPRRARRVTPSPGANVTFFDALSRNTSVIGRGGLRAPFRKVAT